MYQVVNFEISGLCNAKCPWCVTGNKHKYSNILDNTASTIPSISDGQFKKEPFVKVDEFSRAIDRLLDLKLIGKKTCINLYNWGEPLLHPEFNEIVQVLCEKDLLFGISTNASNVVEIKNKAMNNLVHLELSVPGFSQASYDKIHGFKFRNILSNIDILIDRFRKAGYHGQPNLVYHIYQFNIHELSIAANFCEKRKIHFLPYAAYLNDYYLAMGYLQSSLSAEQMKNISKDLLLYYVDDMLRDMPAEYKCPQWDFLTIDENCNVLTCCLIPKSHPDYTIGSLFSMSKEEILNQKVTQNVCNSCISSGLAYWAHQSIVPDFVKRDISSHLKSFIYNSLPKPLLRTVRNSYYRLKGAMRK